jgi:subtilase family serine protease
MLVSSKLHTILAVSACAATFLLPLSGQDNTRTLQDQIPKPVANGSAREIGRYPGSARLVVAIGLPLHDKEGLKSFIDALYDPSSPDYKRYLTPDQFTARFGASTADYQKVVEFVKSSGLTVTAMTPNRMVVDVGGSVSDFERVFHFTMRTYQHPSEPRVFHAPDVQLSFPLGIPILDIMGLDDYAPPRRMAAKATVKPHTAASGSGPNGSFKSKDLRAAYAPGVTLDGSGQTIGLFEVGPYDPNDVSAFEQASGLQNAPIVNVLLDSFDGIYTPGFDDSEVALDIEMAISMAPGVSQVLVYEGFNSLDIVNRMATDNAAKQLSCSYIISDYLSPAGFEPIFMEFAAQGQSFVQSSGDAGAFSLDGGTSLVTNGPGGVWLSETVWNHDGGSSGGGYDLNYPIPSWQIDLSMTANMGSTKYRNYPDVAIVGDTVLFAIQDGQTGTSGGTSASAPLWAGFLALANQHAAASQKPPVGFLNPTIYSLGQGSRYNQDFHDITVGNNIIAGNTTNLYYAVPGFDLTTGWGTPAGLGLIEDLLSLA